MGFGGAVRVVNRIIEAVIRVLSWIASGALALMVLIIMTNVIGRYIFKKPVLGAVEMVGLLTVIVVFCVLALTESQKAHIYVDIIPSRLPSPVKEILASAICFAGGAFFIIMGWQGWELMKSNLVPTVITSFVLSLPFAPFMFIMAFGCVLFGLELLLHAIDFVNTEKQKNED